MSFLSYLTGRLPAIAAVPGSYCILGQWNFAVPVLYLFGFSYLLFITRCPIVIALNLPSGTDGTYDNVTDCKPVCREVNSHYRLIFLTTRARTLAPAKGTYDSVTDCKPVCRQVNSHHLVLRANATYS